MSTQAVSAVDFWKTNLLLWAKINKEICPAQWVELVFSCYCKLTLEQQNALDIKPKGVVVPGTNANYSYSDIVIVLK